MKKITGILTMCFISFVFTCSIEAGTFVSGSTGADGPFNPPTQVPVGTVVNGNNVIVPLPPTGVFNFTTVVIATGITATFQRNASNTPITILSTGDVNIDGTINISGQDGTGNTGNIGPLPGGKGGPGGFDGGYGGEPASTGVDAKLPGNGLGPGGGQGGSPNCTFSLAWYNGGGGGFGSDGMGLCYGYVPNGGNSYGSPTLLPLIGGSGGGGGDYGNYWSNPGGGGGGGGGAILIASSTAINITGSILANGGKGGTGGTNTGGGGSGGAVRLVANVISGNGSMQVVGGRVGPTYSNDGGVGRIRLEGYNVTLNSNNITNPIPSVSIPSLVFLPQVPTLLITKIAGNIVPASASGSYSAPDMTLPSSTTNPISIEIAGTNIPAGATVQISAFPQNGAPSSTTATLTGTDASSTGTGSLSISTTFPSIITAQTTFAIQTAMFYNGERIEKVKIASTIGRDSKVLYITKTGKEIPAATLLAGLMK